MDSLATHLVTNLDTSQALRASRFNEGARPWFRTAWLKDDDGYWLGQLSPGDTLPARNFKEPEFVTFAWNAQEIADQLDGTFQVSRRKGGEYVANTFTGLTAEGPTLAEALANLNLALQEAK